MTAVIIATPQPCRHFKWCIDTHRKVAKVIFLMHSEGSQNFFPSTCQLAWENANDDILHVLLCLLLLLTQKMIKVSRKREQKRERASKS